MKIFFELVISLAQLNHYRVLLFYDFWNSVCNTVSMNETKRTAAFATPREKNYYHNLTIVDL